MKIRVVSHVLENSGYGKACRDIISSLHKAGAELTCNPIILGKASRLDGKYSFINSLLDKNIGKPDYLLQFVLPHHYQYNGLYKKNVGYALFETDNIKSSKMYSYLDLMDEIYTPTGSSSLKFKSVPLPIDLSILDKNIPSIKINEIDHTYKFYTICDYSRRKNIWAMVRIFLRTFIEQDNVSLIIKVFSNEMEPSKFKESLERELAICVNNCGISANKNIVFITERFTEDQIYSLHRYCDCFLSTSFGEAWHYPMVDAMVFSNHVISSLNSASLFFKNIYPGIVLSKSYIEPYHGETDRIPGYHTLYEDCHKVDEIDFIKCLRSIVYKDSKKHDVKSIFKNMTENKIGEKLCERLAV